MHSQHHNTNHLLLSFWLSHSASLYIVYYIRYIIHDVYSYIGDPLSWAPPSKFPMALTRAKSLYMESAYAATCQTLVPWRRRFWTANAPARHRQRTCPRAFRCSYYTLITHRKTPHLHTPHSCSSLVLEIVRVLPLSGSLVPRVEGMFPHTSHVAALGLKGVVVVCANAVCVIGRQACGSTVEEVR
jgi:hypothetical protein